MMYLTATVQVNLISARLPIWSKTQNRAGAHPGDGLVRQFAVQNGEPTGNLSDAPRLARHDPDRTGMLPMVFEPGFGFEHYVDYALDAPMYFVQRDGGSSMPWA